MCNRVTVLCCIGDLVLEIESQPPRVPLEDKPLNAGLVTTFNKHAVVSENRCTKVPSDTDPYVASLFGCAVTTGFGVVENNAKVKMGEAVVVYGAGGIGLNIIQASALSSASPVIAVDRFKSRLELARQAGATHCINSSEGDAAAAIQEALGEQTLDVFIDNTGLPEIIELGYKLIHSQGRSSWWACPARVKPLIFIHYRCISENKSPAPREEKHTHRMTFPAISVCSRGEASAATFGECALPTRTNQHRHQRDARWRHGRPRDDPLLRCLPRPSSWQMQHAGKVVCSRMGTSAASTQDIFAICAMPAAWGHSC